MTTTEEQRQAAVAMYRKCGNLRDVGLAFSVSHESVRQWVRKAEEAEAAARDQQFQDRRRAPRGPVYLKDGRRLGRAALWT